MKLQTRVEIYNRKYIIERKQLVLIWINKILWVTCAHALFSIFFEWNFNFL